MRSPFPFPNEPALVEAATAWARCPGAPSADSIFERMVQGIWRGVFKREDSQPTLFIFRKPERKGFLYRGDPDGELFESPSGDLYDLSGNLAQRGGLTQPFIEIQPSRSRWMAVPAACPRGGVLVAPNVVATITLPRWTADGSPYTQVLPRSATPIPDAYPPHAEWLIEPANGGPPVAPLRLVILAHSGARWRLDDPLSTHRADQLDPTEAPEAITRRRLVLPRTREYLLFDELRVAEPATFSSFVGEDAFEQLACWNIDRYSALARCYLDRLRIRLSDLAAWFDTTGLDWPRPAWLPSKAANLDTAASSANPAPGTAPEEMHLKQEPSPATAMPPRLVPDKNRPRAGTKALLIIEWWETHAPSFRGWPEFISIEDRRAVIDGCAGALCSDRETVRTPAYKYGLLKVKQTQAKM